MQAFENTSTNVAASQMRNALNKLADTVTDPAEKKVSRNPFAPPPIPVFRSCIPIYLLRPISAATSYQHVWEGDLGKYVILSEC